MPITVCLINQKGGCGKSSTCFHLAGAMASIGMNVLLVDIDPQGSLSQGFFGSAFVEDLLPHETTVAFFDNHAIASEVDPAIKSTLIEHVSILPANQCLAPCNEPDIQSIGLAQFSLREFLRDQSQIDVVLIDCPPNLYRCSWMALVAADYVLIPVPPEDFGTQGLRAVHQAIDNVRPINPNLRRLGHLITRYDRRLLIHQSYAERLRRLYPDLVLDTMIPEASAFKVSLACRTPVQQHSPNSLAAELTRQLSREILDRIHRKNTSRQVA